MVMGGSGLVMSGSGLVMGGSGLVMSGYEWFCVVIRGYWFCDTTMPLTSYSFISLVRAQNKNSMEEKRSGPGHLK